MIDKYFFTILDFMRAWITIGKNNSIYIVSTFKHF